LLWTLQTALLKHTFNLPSARLIQYLFQSGQDFRFELLGRMNRTQSAQKKITRGSYLLNRKMHEMVKTLKKILKNGDSAQTALKRSQIFAKHVQKLFLKEGTRELSAATPSSPSWLLLSGLKSELPFPHHHRWSVRQKTTGKIVFVCLEPTLNFIM
jgi:hypothetical protein